MNFRQKIVLLITFIASPAFSQPYINMPFPPGTGGIKPVPNPTNGGLWVQPVRSPSGAPVGFVPPNLDMRMLKPVSSQAGATPVFLGPPLMDLPKPIPVQDISTDQNLALSPQAAPMPLNNNKLFLPMHDPLSNELYQVTPTPVTY